MKEFVRIAVIVALAFGVAAWSKSYQATQCRDAGGVSIRSIIGVHVDCVPRS